MQLMLSIVRPTDPRADTWERLDPKAKKAFLDAMARTIAKAIRPELFDLREDNHDR